MAVSTDYVDVWAHPSVCGRFIHIENNGGKWGKGTEGSHGVDVEVVDTCGNCKPDHLGMSAYYFMMEMSDVRQDDADKASRHQLGGVQNPKRGFFGPRGDEHSLVSMPKSPREPKTNTCSNWTLVNA